MVVVTGLYMSLDVMSQRGITPLTPNQGLKWRAANTGSKSPSWKSCQHHL